MPDRRTCWVWWRTRPGSFSMTRRTATAWSNGCWPKAWWPVCRRGFFARTARSSGSSSMPDWCAMPPAIPFMPKARLPTSRPGFGPNAAWKFSTAICAKPCGSGRAAWRSRLPCSKRPMSGSRNSTGSNRVFSPPFPTTCARPWPPSWDSPSLFPAISPSISSRWPTVTIGFTSSPNACSPILPSSKAREGDWPVSSTIFWICPRSSPVGPSGATGRWTCRRSFSRPWTRSAPITSKNPRWSSLWMCPGPCPKRSWTATV